MKSIFFIFFFMIVTLGFGQTSKNSDDTKSIDAIIKALYEVISGDPNTNRDWDRFKNLFKPEARLIPTRKDEQGKLITKPMTPDEYIQLFRSRIATGFFEKELHRETEEYGTLAHVFSTYETRETQTGPVTNRGINSIQLFKDDDRYYVVSVFWCAESLGFKLPAQYEK
ncbi:MAG: hypothetical protein ACKOE6_07600 [Flammeovirgaceae bacterium]